MQIGKPAWRPAIYVDRKPTYIGEYRFQECPVSYISPESLWILEQADVNNSGFMDARGRREACATLFGPDLRKHPAWWVDAQTVIANVRYAYDKAEIEATKKT